MTTTDTPDLLALAAPGPWKTTTDGDCIFVYSYGMQRTLCTLPINGFWSVDFSCRDVTDAERRTATAALIVAAADPETGLLALRREVAVLTEALKDACAFIGSEFGDTCDEDNTSRIKFYVEAARAKIGGTNEH